MIFTEKKMNVRYLWLFIAASLSYFAIESCGVSYKFTNAKLDYSIYKTIAIGDFPNRAPLVYPPLYQEFNDKLKDSYSRQTRLRIVPQNGDYNVEGAIVGYYLQQLAVGADGLAAKTSLVMNVQVRFNNTKNPQEDFERTFTAQKEFPSTTSFENVQGQLVSEMVDEIVDQIFNATVASW